MLFRYLAEGMVLALLTLTLMDCRPSYWHLTSPPICLYFRRYKNSICGEFTTITNKLFLDKALVENEAAD